MRRSSLRYMKIHDSGLHDSDSILDIYRENPIHPLKLYDNAAFDRQRSATQTRAGAARKKRNAIFIRDANNCPNLLRCARKHDNIRSVFKKRKTVAFVDKQLGFVFHHSGRFQNLTESGYDVRVHGCFCCSFSF
jgi:hypothetical protein